LVRDTPFNISEVKNQKFINAQGVGCCGQKEYMKLYSYTLLEYDVVVHVDMDVIVLKPMDDLFDLMTNNLTYDKRNFQNSTM
jgi:alpha-N-acetylglucosamine transferase